ncbi:MAG: hypothetical protein OES79_11255 [Planctomycetota bacterium]|nr:hypothetical protein [Planctomycetota bacterium]
MATSADDAAWQPAGTRERQAKYSEPDSASSVPVSSASATEAAKKKASTKSARPTRRAGVPRRLERGATRSAKPIRSTADTQRIPAQYWRDPAGTQRPTGARERSAGGSAQDQFNVRQAVANEPQRPRQRAHRAVAYYARPYPMAPWHPHASYSAYATGSGPPARFTAQAPMAAESIGPGEIVVSPDGVFDPEPAPEVWAEGEFYAPDGHEIPFGEAGPCGCDGPCDGAGSCFGYPLFGSIFLGMQGFKGPQDLGRNGNFGFHQGFEIAVPSPIVPISFQLGLRFTQSNFEGNQVTDSYRSDSREQVFLTTGLFRRADGCCPWQWGVVFDWMHDEYWVEADFSQVRLEISRHTRCGNEWGFLAAFGTGEENFDDQRIRELEDFDFGAKPTDYYGVFWRRATAACGEWRLLAGVTERSDTILGGDFWLPVGSCLALDGDFTFLIAENDGLRGQQEEAFGVGLSLVWYPYRPPRNVAGNPLRPLLRVADNARFFVNRK